MTTIPAARQQFLQCALARGFVDILMNQTTVNGDILYSYTLATEDVRGNQILLYATTKPEPRTFRTPQSLQKILLPLGIRNVRIPTDPGPARNTFRCRRLPSHFPGAMVGVTLAAMTLSFFPNGDRIDPIEEAMTLRFDTEMRAAIC